MIGSAIVVGKSLGKAIKRLKQKKAQAKAKKQQLKMKELEQQAQLIAEILEKKKKSAS